MPPIHHYLNFFKALFSQEQQLHLWTAIFIAHLVFASVLGLKMLGGLQTLELYIYDIAQWSRPKNQMPDDRLTIVWFTDEDQQKLGFPLTDEKLANLFNKLFEHNPKVIGLDIYRDLPVPLGEGAGYRRLENIFSNNQNIFGIRKLAGNAAIGSQVNPPPALAAVNRVGFNDMPVDKGGTVRRGLLYASDQKNVHEHFSLKVALYYLAQKNIYPKQHPTDPTGLQLGAAQLVPLDPYFGGYIAEDMGGFQYMFDYPGAPNVFRSVTVTDVLNNKVDPDLIRDKIVVIGVNAEATPDFLYPPLGTTKSDPRMPGALVHAFGIMQLILMAEDKLKPLVSWTEFQEYVWIWFWCILGTILCIWARSAWRFMFVSIGGLCVLAGIGYFALTLNLWLLIAAPAIGWILTNATTIAYLSYQEKNQRAVLMQIFSKHVSKEVAEVIWREREQYLNAGRLVPQRLTATVLFTDLQNFTTIAETMDPPVLMDWINQYMEAMVQTVEKHEGQVNKFIGDAIMALFGVPIPSVTPDSIARDAANAVNCALEMRAEITRLQAVWVAQGMPQVRMRIGIYTGSLVAGSLGSVERQEYTVLGDTVNIASRLESFNKEIDADSSCRILIGEATLKQLNQKFVVEEVGEVGLKGKELKIKIYRVICAVSDLNK